MKILMFTPWNSIHSERALNCLLESGHEIVLVDSDNPYPQGRKGYRFFKYPRTGERHYRRFIDRRIANRMSLALSVLQLNLLWRRLQPDVVHVSWLDYRAYHCLKAGLKPLVLSVWGTDVNANLVPEADPNELRILAQALAGVDLTIVDAPDMPRKCAQLAGQKIETEQLHLGVNTKLFRPYYESEATEWRERLGIPATATIFFSMRALSANYNHHLILDAFAETLRRTGADAWLLFKIYNVLDPQYEKELRWQAEKLGLGNRVRWISEVPFKRLPELYGMADAVLNFPSMDAFPVTFMEAAACECPVISGALGSYAGTFAEKYFQMIPVEDVGALSQTMTAFLLQSEAEKRQLRSRLEMARQEVVAEFDESAYAKRLLGIYEKVSKRRRQSMRQEKA